MSELLELADRCEQATGPDRELDWLIFAATCGKDTSTVFPKHRYLYGENYTASLGAAMTLTFGFPEAVVLAICKAAYEAWAERGKLTADDLARCISTAALRAKAAAQ